jgi:hypothetical protein
MLSVGTFYKVEIYKVEIYKVEIGACRVLTEGGEG